MSERRWIFARLVLIVVLAVVCWIAGAGTALVLISLGLR